MKQHLYRELIGREGIFFERGFVCGARILEVAALNSDGEGARFDLKLFPPQWEILRVPQAEASLESDLEVGSLHLSYEKEVLRASGYVSWSIIFNAALIDCITKEIEQRLARNEEFDAYHICRNKVSTTFARRT